MLPSEMRKEPAISSSERPIAAKNVRFSTLVRSAGGASRDKDPFGFQVCKPDAQHQDPGNKRERNSRVVFRVAEEDWLRN